MSQVGLINTIQGIKFLRYLELGSYDGHHASGVDSIEKTTVDRMVVGKYPASHLMTTDQFFATIPIEQQWDVIYIDADHHHRSIFKDFNNSIRHLAPGGHICLHDMYPDCVADTAPHVSGSGFLFLNAMLEMGCYDIHVLNGDYGWAFVNQPTVPVDEKHMKILSYEDFCIRWDIPRLTVPEMADIIKELTNG